MTSGLTIFDLNKLSNNITETTKTINRNGLENTTENLFYKLRNDTIQHLKDTELKGISAAENKYQHYDDIFKNMKTVLDEFKSKVMGKLNDTNNISSANIDLNGLLDSFKRLENSKIDGELMFDHNSEVIIGDGLRAPRTFDSNFIKVDGVKISEIMQTFIDNDKPNLDDFKKIEDLVNLRHAEVGARWNGLKSTKSIYENTKLTENEFMDKRFKLEEAFQQLNDLSLSYEALSKTIAKISSLSLVNYI